MLKEEIFVLFFLTLQCVFQKELGLCFELWEFAKFWSLLRVNSLIKNSVGLLLQEIPRKSSANFANLSLPFLTNVLITTKKR